MKQAIPGYLRLFQAEIWQKEWNGISLLEVAQEMGLPGGKVASSHFYELYYKKLGKNQFDISEQWTKQKQQMTRLFQEKIDSMPLVKDSKVISLGAGLGIIELPLLLEGYNIHLQECQEESLAYIRQKTETVEWITSDLSIIPDNSYDLALVSIVSYVFAIDEYQSFLKNVSRILRPGGTLVLWDLECPIPFLYGQRGRLKRLLGRDIAVRWGWSRTRLVHQVLGAICGLALSEARSLDDVYNQVDVKKVLGFVLPKSKAVLQELTFVNEKEG